MTVGEARLSSAELLARHLLWSRTVNGRDQRQPPVVVLLGPAGSGKTAALKAISADCGHGVVHAYFGFATTEQRTDPITTVEVLTEIARRLSRGWKNRRSARFTRFALGLVAIQTQLNTAHRHHAKDDLRAAIKEWSRMPNAVAAADRVGALLNAANVLPAPLMAVIRTALPDLVKTVVHRPFGKAQRWHSDIPEAEGASPEDALIALNDAARTDPVTTTSWLTQAFLADVRENHPLMATTEPGAPCICDIKPPHFHNWILLLDDLHLPGGSEFVADLATARERHLEQHRNDHDPLVIISSSGRWNSDWESEWRVPWKSAPSDRDGLATVPLCHSATYQHWAENLNSRGLPPTCYPVLLDPLGQHDTARLLRTRPTDPNSELAQRATGGLPMAVLTLKPLLTGKNFVPGARDVLGPSVLECDPDSGEPALDIWQERLNDLRLGEYLTGIEIRDFVSAAAFATAPWLVPADARSIISTPQVGRILTELRTALWVTAPEQAEATPNYAELHPWIAQTLISALVARHEANDQPTFATLFGRLLADQEHTEGRTENKVRKIYCQLALGQVSDVVDYFTAIFNKAPHQVWIDQLRLVTRAPNGNTYSRSSSELFKELVDADIEARPQRSEIRNIVTRLLIGLWLAKNPFVMPDHNRWRDIADEYRQLPPKASGPDVAALNTASKNAARGIL